MNLRVSKPKPAAVASRSRNRKLPKKKPTKPRKSFKHPLVGLRTHISEHAERYRLWGRRLGKLGLALALLAVLVWAGRGLYQYVRSAQAFAIVKVHVEGHQRLDEMEVRRAARLLEGQNVFEVSPAEAQEHLLRHPWIKSAEVSRRLPGEYRVVIEERRPVALAALDQLYLVSDDGVVFKRLSVDDPANLPVITGIASERFYDDFDYRTAVLLRSLAVLQDYEGSGLSEREPVSEIHFEGERNVELFVGDDGIQVRLGADHHRQRLRRFRRILDGLAREKSRPAYVYLDNDRRPNRVTVRLQDSESAVN